MCAFRGLGAAVAMTFKQFRRRLGAKVLPRIAWGLFRLTWKTCTIRAVQGNEHLEALLEIDKPFIPCYWHQQQLFCVRYLLDAAAKDSRLKLGYLISPSADGDIASNMFGNEGVHVIRGSATRGGAQALRDIYMHVKQDKISPIVTPDGPTGPIYQCKPGVALLSQLRVGEPVHVKQEDNKDDFTSVCDLMNNSLNNLSADCKHKAGLAQN